MRVVKDAKERRNEILDHAFRLFVSKGYENTSVTDILNEIGIAKGTLYYHFKSKEEILNGVIDRIFEISIEKANDIANSKELSVQERILRILLSFRIKEASTMEILEELHKPQNALMHQKMLKREIVDVTPILARVIEEGNQQGIFHTDYPYESTELFMTYGNIIFDTGFMDFPEEDLKKKVAAFITNLERVVGAKPGSLGYVNAMFPEMGGEEDE